MNDGIKYSPIFQCKNLRASNKDSKGQTQNKQKELLVQWAVAMATPCQWMINMLEVYMGQRGDY